MQRINLSPSQQRSALPYRAVFVQCLDENEEDAGAFGSGFIVAEDDGLYLYTCWHVVTGYDPRQIDESKGRPRRKYLKVVLQDVRETAPGVTEISGSQSHTIPLYDFSMDPHFPLWSQDSVNIPNFALDCIRLKVPALHDVVKIRMPESVKVSPYQFIYPPRFTECVPPVVGEKVFVVGYPYGFSAYGMEQPTAIVLTRFVAAAGNSLRDYQFLLEGFGADGMSGGPVFIERGDQILLLGIYTGVLFPDRVTNQFSEQAVKWTALGECGNLNDIWQGNPLIPYSRGDRSEEGEIE